MAWVGRVRCLGCDLEVGTQCPARRLTLPPALLPRASGIWKKERPGTLIPFKHSVKEIRRVPSILL